MSENIEKLNGVKLMADAIRKEEQEKLKASESSPVNIIDATKQFNAGTTPEPASVVNPTPAPVVNPEPTPEPTLAPVADDLNQ